MTRQLSVNYRYSLKARGAVPANAGWRPRLAWFFRRAADRLDHGNSIRIEVDSQPWVGAHEAARCIDRGIELSGQLLGEATKARHIDELMRQHCPHLYEQTHD